MPKEPSFLRFQLSSDDSFLVYYCLDTTSAYITPNPFANHETSLIISVNRLFSPYIIFENYLIATFLENKDLSLKKGIIEAYPDLRVYPFGWNFFHIVAIFEPKTELIKLCIELKIPFSVDNNKKTPLHYLLDKEVYDFAVINYILENFQEITAETGNIPEIISSLSDQLPKILELDTPQVVNLLVLAFAKPQKFMEGSLPTFGNIRDGKEFRFFRSQHTVLDPGTQDQLIETKGDEMLSICVVMFYLKYSIISDDMWNLSKTLCSCEEEGIFKTKAISVIIDYMWESAKLYHTVVFLIYSQGMLVISIYVALGSGSPILQLIILIDGLVYLAYELFQVYNDKSLYFQDLWNNIDLISVFAIIALPLGTWIDDESPLLRSWLEAIVISLGFMRWVSFFRIFDNTRRLMRIIVEIIKDMRSFTLVIVSILIGFTLIFHAFRPEVGFFFVMDQVYNLLYANSKFDELSASEYFFYVMITVSLSVVLLNMLIAVMGDTYARVQETAVLSDSKDKLALILETITVDRALAKGGWLPKKFVEEQKESYLFFAKEDMSYEQALYEGIQPQWEGKFNNMKKFLKSQIQEQTVSMEKQYATFRDDFYLVNEDIALIKRKIERINDYLGRSPKKIQDIPEEAKEEAS